MEKINVIVNGACGKMGCEVVKAISRESDIRLAGAVDILNEGIDVGEIAGIGKSGVNVTKDLAKTIKDTKADIVVDFTAPKTIIENVRTAAENKAHIIVGTTGVSENNINELTEISKKYGINIFVAPNFAISAVLMMRFAAEAIKHMPKAEIIELHHDKKLDAPSGTSIKTAEMMQKSGNVENVPIHSVRLPGLVAHQEVIFGGLGQTLTIRHDSINRESFMPGVILAIRKIRGTKGLTWGLENLI